MNDSEYKERVEFFYYDKKSTDSIDYELKDEEQFKTESIEEFKNIYNNLNNENNGVFVYPKLHGELFLQEGEDKDGWVDVPENCIICFTTPVNKLGIDSPRDFNNLGELNHIKSDPILKKKL